jgi:hypothetical protein
MKSLTFIVSIICLLIAIYLFSGEVGHLHYQNRIDAVLKRGQDKNDNIPVNIGNDSIRLPSKWHVEQQELAEKEQNFLRPFFWIQVLPDDFNLIIACCGLSLFGFIITLLLTKRSIKNNRRLTQQFLAAFLTGIVIFFIVKGIPQLFRKEPNEFFMLALSLLSGLFLYKFYAILSKKFPNLFV